MAGGAVGAGWGLDGRDCCSLVCSRFGSPVSGVARVVRWRAPKLGIVFLAKPGELLLRMSSPTTIACCCIRATLGLRHSRRLQYCPEKAKLLL